MTLKYFHSCELVKLGNASNDNLLRNFWRWPWHASDLHLFGGIQLKSLDFTLLLHNIIGTPSMCNGSHFEKLIWEKMIIKHKICLISYHSVAWLPDVREYYTQGTYMSLTLHYFFTSIVINIIYFIIARKACSFL